MGLLRCEPKPVRRALDAPPAPVQHMRIDHRGADIGMPEQFLDGADVVSILKKVGREGVAQGVAACRLRDARVQPRLPE